MTVIMFDKPVFVFAFLVQKFDGLIAALENGLTVDLSGLPPSPSQSKARPSVLLYKASRLHFGKCDAFSYSFFPAY